MVEYINNEEVPDNRENQSKPMYKVRAKLLERWCLVILAVIGIWYGVSITETTWLRYLTYIVLFVWVSASIAIVYLSELF